MQDAPLNVSTEILKRRTLKTQCSMLVESLKEEASGIYAYVSEDKLATLSKEEFEGLLQPDNTIVKNMLDNNENGNNNKHVPLSMYVIRKKKN